MVTVEMAKGIHFSVDPAHTRVEVQKKERNVAGFKLQQSPWSHSVLSVASQDVHGTRHSTKHTTERDANLLFVVLAQAW